MKSRDPKAKANTDPYPGPINKGTGPDHPWRSRPKPESMRVAVKRKRTPQPSRLPPRIREILERTRKAMSR